MGGGFSCQDPSVRPEETSITVSDLQEDQEAAIRERFSVRRRRAIVLWAIWLCLFLGGGVLAKWKGPPRIAGIDLGPLVVGLAIASVAFHVVNWRCPRCKAYLGNWLLVERCAHCQARLE